MRICHIIFISIMVMSFGFADDQCSNCNHECKEESNFAWTACSEAQPSISLKAGYFFFTDSKLRKIYDQGGFDVRITGSYPIWNYLQVYGSVEYLERHGKSLGGHQKTKIWEVPVSLGLKAILPIAENLNYYLTLGPRYFYVHTHNNSSYVDRNMCRNVVGGFANTGLKYSPCNNLFMDVFAEYSYGRTRFHSSRLNSYGERVQIGGIALGAGAGYTF